MESIAAWVAPAATIVAAMMVAANLGTRVTGWGFVVYTVGAIAWCAQGVATHQYNLLWANGFLLVVDVIGVYRWLFQRAALDEGAEAAVVQSEREETDPLFPLSHLVEAPLCGPDGSKVAHILDAMAECGSGRISYLMLREGGAGGIGERFHALPWADVTPCDKRFTTALDGAAIRALPQVDPRDWPAAAPAP
ncbi:MAG: PRC-barrel domain-containing protein [Sphingomonadaceae bacterium]|nr:PRC-barrel domain-containing protein [Sphingomonadaceae bacterium]